MGRRKKKVKEAPPSCVERHNEAPSANLEEDFEFQHQRKKKRGKLAKYQLYGISQKTEINSGDLKFHQQKKKENEYVKEQSFQRSSSEIDETDFDLELLPSRMSIKKGWKRVFDKYSPSKEATMSPLKATEGNLTYIFKRDPYIESVTWTVNMSEQHFYDNAFLLLSYAKNSKQKIASMLHQNFIGVDMDFFNDLIEITTLGNGSFGRVYSCRDPKTNLKYAVKHIFGEYKKYSDHTNHLLDYLAERNSSIKAMESAFVVKLYYSLQLKSFGDLFLFFEYCISDLSTYLDNIEYDSPKKLSNFLYHHQIGIIQKLYTQSPELLEVCFIYIFEILCGLDFLVKCNMIHRDIKPRNIMVSQNLHLKIGDFGIVFKTRTIHKRTNMTLINPNDLKDTDEKNYKVDTGGTKPFEDFELQLLLLEKESKEALDKVLADKKKFDTPMILFTDDVMKPSFLVDTWAAGVIFVSLLFRKFLIVNPFTFDDNIFRDIPRDSKPLFIINLVGRQLIYSKYIFKGLIASGDKPLEELMRFIASIFKPRSTRCQYFIKEKNVYQFSKLVKMKYIDLDEVEKIRTFAERNFCRSNIHLRQIPKIVETVYPPKKVENKTFKKLLKEIEDQRSKNTCPSSVMILNPAMTINFFT